MLEALAQGADLANGLGLELSGGAPPIHGWIVDTSIERDHERFSGFLKLSLEELFIALRDDISSLTDPEGLFHGGETQKASARAFAEKPRSLSLYPSGFSAGNLLDVVEAEAVWALI
ncbi:hypothetical protein [Variovorax boronicumulans]|uniref:hypothetical protein n=1 Tax=Variovorax boronicumulans TaxID=436515 RepID=UPI001112EDCB|nr:hypothetical protein [Variovorax boronicumulans]